MIMDARTNATGNSIDGDDIADNETLSDSETVENGDLVCHPSDDNNSSDDNAIDGDDITDNETSSNDESVEFGDMCLPPDDNHYITEEGNNENSDDVGNIVAGWSGIGEVFDTALDEMAIVGPTIPHKRVLWLFSGESIWDLFKSAGESLAKNISIDELRKKFSGKWDGVTGNAEYKNQESAFESLKGKLQ